jgi:hypothetical protein
MSLVDTDLNPRERARFARQIDMIAKDATKIAAALRVENDTEALICLVTLSLTMGILDELRKVFEETITSAKTKAPDDVSTLFKENKTP